MRHCLLTTFFGAHSFGGDASYVDHLSRALLRRGDEVLVVYNRDAFEVLKGDRKDRVYEPPVGLRIHALQTRSPLANLLFIHQTGGLGPYRKRISETIEAFKPDVVHFHNVSLIGGLDLLTMRLPDRVVRMMTAHEHWLTCPLSLLWKLDREACEKPECIRCTISAKRPPQLWRSGSRMEKALGGLDRLIFPSEDAKRQHERRDVFHPRSAVLPYFLPDAWMALSALPPISNRSITVRPYFMMAGRLIKEKGFHTAIPLMAGFQDADLIIAGSGPYRSELEKLAEGLPNVRFLDSISQSELVDLYRDAKAVIVPSLFHETFCYIVIEAFSTRTPVLVRDLGPMPGLVKQSNGGLTFKTGDDLTVQMRRILEDDALRSELGENGHRAIGPLWSEEVHMRRYMDMIRDSASRKQSR